MKFVLIDRILEFEPERRIVATKALSLAEEYLADHFPSFPVMPGVLMLEAMTQASAWLVRASTDFSAALVVLKEARNVTYKSFVAPGQVLHVEAICKELGPELSTFAATGSVDGREIVKARLTLRHMDVSDAIPGMAQLDETIRSRMRGQFDRLLAGHPAAAAAT